MKRATTSFPRCPRAILLTLPLACGPAAAPGPAPAPLMRATQLVVVGSADWDATAGELRRFERDALDAPWRPVHGDGAATPVVIGRGGLGWGVGFDTLAAGELAGPRKREGDGRAPAGAFALGTPFGFAPPDSMPSVGPPYLMLGPGTECVDDTGSAHYGRVVDRGEVAEPDWRSAEGMRAIPLYRLGVLVDYNADGAAPGRGSCIFLHIWDGPDSTTSGCTALAADPLAALVAWLDADARPALVQLPTGVYQRLRTDWGLPPLRE